MSARIETANKSLARIAETEVEKIRIVGFDAKRFRAPFTLRCAALLIDYLILIIAPVLALMLSRSAGVSGAKIFDNQSYYVGWLISSLLLVTNFVILPAVSGRTIGKAAMGLRVVQKDGRGLTFTSAMLRHLIGYPLTFLSGGLGFLLAIFNAKGRALHDFIAGTVVVQAGQKQLKFKDKA
ncbi:MAG: RDD family protein [Pyrinomonadaceae bacterium]